MTNLLSWLKRRKQKKREARMKLEERWRNQNERWDKRTSRVAKELKRRGIDVWPSEIYSFEQEGDTWIIGIDGLVRTKKKRKTRKRRKKR